ncbi:FtsX-like permease family protein [Isoptericola sp. NEAU-Y5]|uniref:FtsX-like permease family protein n=1 Tax=Isoptericola luteus TaxID=2879484 RepID=A0ABS7ZES2_9MICO|nr:FtsX-like permease family protein [Isoptericola sp. NEAU-Y5]MCA5892791.1 FtsX-like permease family protein [Isoptericola sp. NEAU-Y5]
MIRITLAQMRRSVGRLAAAGIAIVIGTAFVAVTLLAGNVITSTTYDSIAAQYRGSDLVAGGVPVDDAGLDAVRQVAGVSSADEQLLSFQQLEHGNRTIFQGVLATPSDPAMLPLDLADGALPAGAGQIALPPDVAERFGVEVGEDITLVRNTLVDADADVWEWEEAREQLTVTGIVDDPYGAYSMFGGAAVAPATEVQAWEADLLAPGEVSTEPSTVLVGLDDGADVEQTRAAIDTALSSAVTAAGGDASDLEVVTPTEHAESVAAQMTGGDNIIFTTFVLVFAAVALLVAALVIANTFQVLVAQRTRTLALLRCVGADKGQLRRSVLFEASVLGLASSALGILLGTGIAQAALTIGSGMDLGIPLPTSIDITPAVVIAPLVVGTLVTLVAALAPARAATRVAPLAALRPADAPSSARGAGRFRLIASLVATVIGFVVLGGGVAISTVGDAPSDGILVALLGGSMSFVGVLVGSVFWLPRVVALAGRLVGASGPTARLAAANTLRNPRRTAATSTALLIGVTLVGMMSTAAASARLTMDSELDARYPVDVTVSSDLSGDGSDAAAMPVGLAGAIGDVDGVATVVEVPATLSGLTGPGVDPGAEVMVRGVTPDDATSVLRSPEMVAPLAAGTVVVPEGIAEVWSITDGQTLTFDRPDGELEVTAAVTELQDDAVVVVPADLATLDAAAPTTALYVGLEHPGDAASVVPDIQDVVADTEAPVNVMGAAVERAGFEQVIDTALAIVVGLLGVAVVIALIGVANTLSLSVIERRRESATLRAIGLSKGQLRGMLAVEGVLIALVGAVLGVLLGLVYGWTGAAAALGWAGEPAIVVPWADVSLMIGVALVAGLVASVVPARSAVKTSPVEALATE